MSGHDFKFGREVGFFQRMFGQSFTPKEVDAIQRREGQRRRLGRAARRAETAASWRAANGVLRWTA